MHMTIPTSTHPDSTGISPGTATERLHGFHDMESSGTIDSTGNEPNCRFVAHLSPDEVHRRALAAGRLLGRAEKTLASWLVEIDDRKLYRDFSCSSIFHYAARFLKLAGHTVAEYLRTGRKLAGLPLLSASYEKGEISGTHIREITRVATAETESFWHEAARNCTTREIEKMVAFTPKGGLPPVKKHEAASLPLFQETTSTPGMGTEDHACRPDAGDPVSCRPTPVSVPVCCAHGSCTSEKIGQSGYHHKLVIDLTAEEMAVVHDALRKARKESGKSDRRSLLVYMARVFLQGSSPDDTVKKSAKPPYQVVFHHHLPSGLSWCETAKGERPLPLQVLEKALCDAEIREAEDGAVPDEISGKKREMADLAGTAGPSADFMGSTHHPGDPAGDAHEPFGAAGDRSHSPDPAGNWKETAGTTTVECQQEKMAYVNELYRKMKAAPLTASPGGKYRQRRARTTIPSALRKRVLERDGHRCQVPGCGRDRFTVLHHLNPVALGGRDEASALIVLCWSCHDLLHEGGLSLQGHAPDNLRWGEGI